MAVRLRLDDEAVAFLQPNFVVIVILMLLLVFSFLLHLDPSITHNGGVSALPDVSFSTADWLVILGIVVLTSLSLAALIALSVTISAWFAAATAAVVIGAIALFTKLGLFFGALLNIVTFGGLGFPPEIQILFAVPCVVALLWTILAVLAGVFGATGG